MSAATIKDTTGTRVPVLDKKDLEKMEELIKESESFDLSPHLVKLLLNEPFFSTLLRDVTKIKSYSISTAGVTVNDSNFVLYWNPIFVMSLSTEHIRGLLKHECYHLIFKHCTGRKQDPHILWNIATDLAINSLICESELPSEGLVPGKPLTLDKITDPSQLEKWKKLSDIIENMEKGWASERYMEILRENEDEIKEMFENSSGEGGTPVDMDDHDGWGDMSDEERQVAEGKLKQALAKAVRKCDRDGNWGTVSSGMRSTLREMTNDAINWKRIIQNFCGNSQRSSKIRTHRRVNRKYPYIHPGIKRGRSATVAIYMDQSGSVSDSDIELFFGCLNQLGKMTTFLLYPFDWEIDDEKMVKWKRGQKKPPVRTACGGTSFDAVEDHVRKNISSFDGHIILTDGGASDPGPSRQRRCWVLLPGCTLPFSPHKGDIVVEMDRNAHV